MKRIPLWRRAAECAARAHEHQYRNDRRTPYAAHPSCVALTIATVFGIHDDHVLAAAYLHDAIEDTGMDYDEIAEDFGPAVADLVAVMTKDMRMVEPEREEAYDAQLAAGPWEGRLLKLADVHDNLLGADDDGAKRRMLAKARRALVLAADDAELAGPREQVEALVRAVEAELAS